MTDTAFQTLDGFLTQVLQRLTRGVADRRAPARHPTLATMGPDGPALRTVVLRAFDASAAHLDIHTDRRSQKVLHLKRDPRCEIHVWDAKADLQIRIKALASVLSGEAGAPHWQRVPEPARRVYGGCPAPGKVLATPEDHDATLDPADQFCVLRLAMQSIDALHLGADRHRRMRSTRNTQGWDSVWIAP